MGFADDEGLGTGTLHTGFYRGCIGIMEKKMESTI